MRRMIFTGLGASLLALISAQAMAAMLLHQQRSPMPRSLGPALSQSRAPLPKVPIATPQRGVKTPICNGQVHRGPATKIPMSQLPPPGLCTGQIVGSYCVTCSGTMADSWCFVCANPGYVFKPGHGCCPGNTKLPIPK
jgi:hypothetical protein